VFSTKFLKQWAFNHVAREPQVGNNVCKLGVVQYLVSEAIVGYIEMEIKLCEKKSALQNLSSHKIVHTNWASGTP
jgi:hypothetical protein